MNYKIKEITEFSDTTVAISWEDGHESLYLYEDLRKICPCATCRKLRSASRTGKLPFKKKIPVGTMDKNIRPQKIEYVGNYAIQFFWNDRHNTGIYSFDFLKENCTCKNCAGNG